MRQVDLQPNSPFRGEITGIWVEGKCPRTLAASRFGESLNRAAVEHQHQNPSAGPKELHSPTLGFRRCQAPGAAAFVMNEKEE